MRRMLVVDQQRAHLTEPRSRRIEYALRRIQYRLLRQTGQAQLGLAPYNAVVRGRLPRQHFEQAGLARAVASDQSELVPGFDDELHAIEQRYMSVCERD